MKNHTILSDIIVFLLINIFFIIPPFFSAPITSASVFSEWKFPVYQFMLAALCPLLLNSYYEKSYKKSLIVFPVLFTFGMLFSISLFCRFLYELIGSSSLDQNELVVRPQGFLQCFFCLINFLCAAFYEEVLYRFYFSDELYSLITRKKTIPFACFICELLGLLVFAFAHLYMGWISVLNAALAHIFLRLCYKKSGKLWPCVTAHFIYNVISLILL